MGDLSVAQGSMDFRFSHLAHRWFHTIVPLLAADAVVKAAIFLDDHQNWMTGITECDWYAGALRGVQKSVRKSWDLGCFET